MVRDYGVLRGDRVTLHLAGVARGGSEDIAAFAVDQTISQ